MNKIILVIIAAMVVTSCQQEVKKTPQGKMKLVCTTGMLGDALEKIVGDKATVTSLMGSGVDPHLYKATQGDLKYLSEADVIIYNGLHLEGKMGEVFHKLEKRKHILTAAAGIPENQLINNTEFQGAQDPHIWFDVMLWSQAIEHLANELGKIDTSNAIEFKKNASAYLAELEKLDQEIESAFSVIDSSKRVLITAHDAFSYFGVAYGLEVRGLQGISTVSEYGLKDVSNLVAFIVDRKIPSVFIESSVSDRSLKAVVEGCKAKGHKVKIGGTLFSDAMGEKGTKEGTYIGMVEHNVNTILDGLK